MLNFIKRSAIPRVLLIIGVLVFLLSRFETTSDDRLKLLAKVPLGSGVTAIKPLLNDEHVRGSSVHGKRDPGRWFNTEDPVDYESSGVADQGAKPFTGEIYLFVDGPLGNDTIVGFTFKNGTLTKKNWGVLPS
jgi:hypothetical protein